MGEVLGVQVVQGRFHLPSGLEQLGFWRSFAGQLQEGMLSVNHALIPITETYQLHLQRKTLMHATMKAGARQLWD